MNSKKAVAYLAQNKDQQPEELVVLFEKLASHESGITGIQEAISKTQKTLEELAKQFDLKIGAIEGLVDAIATLLPEDKVDEWANEFDNSNNGE